MALKTNLHDNNPVLDLDPSSCSNQHPGNRASTTTPFDTIEQVLNSILASGVIVSYFFIYRILYTGKTSVVTERQSNGEIVTIVTVLLV